MLRVEEGGKISKSGIVEEDEGVNNSIHALILPQALNSRFILPEEHAPTPSILQVSSMD